MTFLVPFPIHLARFIQCMLPHNIFVPYSILLQEPEPFLILILDKILTGQWSMISIVLDQSHTFLSATSQESAHQMDVVEMMMLVCAVGHVRTRNSRFSLLQEVQCIRQG